MKPVTTPAWEAPTSRHTAQHAPSAKSADASANASSSAFATGGPTSTAASVSTALAKNDTAPSVERACRRPAVRDSRSVVQPPARLAAPASTNGSDENAPPATAENPSSCTR